MYSNEQQSLEVFVGPDNVIAIPPGHGFSQAPSHPNPTRGTLGSESSIVMGELVAGLTGVTGSGPPGGHDLSFVQAPREHRLHGFMNGVRSIMTDLLNSQAHRRRKRSPLPHATPGNVFETRLVGCRAGAVRDINAKCRNTILPARSPPNRATRATPPVPPHPRCPPGQSFNIQRMCTSKANAIGSINAFNLG